MGPKKARVVISCVRSLAQSETGRQRPSTPPELLAGLTDHLPARERDVVHRRFGIGSGDRCTLAKIGGDYGLTRERIRLIERDAMEGIALHFGTAPLRGALEHYDGSIWEIVSEPPGVLHREALRPRLRLLSGRYELLVSLVHGSMGAWLESSCHEHARVWFRTSLDPVRVVESIGRVERRLDGVGLPVPLAALCVALGTEPDLTALCVALSERYVIHRGFVCRLALRREGSVRRHRAPKSAPTIRARRAIGLHGVLSRRLEDGPMEARALIEEYGEIRPRDTFGYGELRHVLETNPQLFLPMGRYGWYPLHGAADPGPPGAGEDDGSGRAPPDGRGTIRSVLVDILGETGALRFIELREIFKRRSKGAFRTRDGISSILRTNGEFTRVAPGCYDLTERAERYDPVTQCSDALMHENACVTYAVCRHAGGPVTACSRSSGATTPRGCPPQGGWPSRSPSAGTSTP